MAAFRAKKLKIKNLKKNKTIVVVAVVVLFFLYLKNLLFQTTILWIDLLPGHLNQFYLLKSALNLDYIHDKDELKFWNNINSVFCFIACCFQIIVIVQ